MHADGLELQARRRDRFKALAMLQLLLATHHFKYEATLAWDIGLLSYAGIEERWVSLTNAVHKTLQVLRKGPPVHLVVFSCCSGASLNRVPEL